MHVNWPHDMNVHAHCTFYDQSALADLFFYSCTVKTSGRLEFVPERLFSVILHCSLVCFPGKCVHDMCVRGLDDVRRFTYIGRTFFVCGGS